MALYGIMGGLRVSSVSTSAHTAASISSLTWAQLSEYSKAISRDNKNTYSNSIRSVTFSDGATLGIGDYLNIAINSVNYRVDIIGFHHDEVTDSAAYGGTYAGITWQMHDCYTTTYAMNSPATNVGGWGGCQMRTSTMATLYGLLASSVSDAIVPVDKLTSAGNQSGTINTSSDSLFLLSEVEVANSVAYSFSGEGVQYAYYAAGNSAIKKDPTFAKIWWLRSPLKTSSGYFDAVLADGTVYRYAAGATYRVAFAFCT